MSQINVGVLGLGAIGLPVALNLSKSINVQAWNRTRERYSLLQGSQVQPIENFSEFNTSIFLVFLPDEKSILEILAHGLLDVMQKDDLLVVMGTVSPLSMKKINQIIVSKDARSIDAPVSGGDVGAQRGELSIMVGGSNLDFKRIEPVLSLTAKSVRHVGSLGQAQTLKACNQIIVGANLVAIAESLTLARRSGISDEDFFSVISTGLAGSSALNTKWEKLTSGNFTAGGKSDYQLKDMKVALDIAHSISLSLPISELVTEIYEVNRKLGNSELDHCSVILQYLDKNEI